MFTFGRNLFYIFIMTKFIQDDNTEEYVLVVKNRKFPWWIFLLLLPLILLIPISRDVHVKILDDVSKSAVAMQNCKFNYSDVSTFGTKTPVDLQVTTDENGDFHVLGIKQPLWYVIFGGNGDNASVAADNDCQTLNFTDLLINYPKDDFKVIEMQQIEGQKVVKVIDSDTRKPLDGANVYYSNFITEPVTLLTDETGLANISIPKCSDVVIVSSKTGYITDTLKTALANVMDSDTIVVPLRKLQDLKGLNGKLRFNLQWFCHADLDLHVIDPCGNEIFYQVRKANCNGKNGVLDLDANGVYDRQVPFEQILKKLTDRPQENIYWKDLETGVYTIKIVRFAYHDADRTEPMLFNVSVIDRGNRSDMSGKFYEQSDSVVVYTHEVK